MDFQLFKIQVFPSNQGELFGEPLSKREILEQTVQSSPETEFRTGIVWHIGNFVQIDPNSLYLRLGRTTRSTVEIYRDGNFIDAEFEAAPYTHVLIDFNLELLAIAKKPRLSPYITGIKNSFTKLLNSSERAHSLQAKFSIDYIKDPENFLEHLRSSEVISRFSVSYKRPNAFDINEDFIKPNQRLVEETNSTSGKTQLVGENLNSDVLEELARSAAASGDDAEAWLIPEGENNKVRKSLTKNPVVVHVDDIDDTERKKSFIERIRIIYHRIRGNGQSDERD